MLVLSRKVNERVFIDIAGFRIEVTCVRVGPNSVRLGFAADERVGIVRAELDGVDFEEPPGELIVGAAGRVC